MYAYAAIPKIPNIGLRTDLIKSLNQAEADTYILPRMCSLVREPGRHAVNFTEAHADHCDRQLGT